MAAGVSLVLLSYPHRILDTKAQLYDGDITQNINISFDLLLWLFLRDFVVAGKLVSPSCPSRANYYIFSSPTTAAMRFLSSLARVDVHFRSFFPWKNKISRTCVFPHWHFGFNKTLLLFYFFCPLDEFMNMVRPQGSLVYRYYFSLMKTSQMTERRVGVWIGMSNRQGGERNAHTQDTLTVLACRKKEKRKTKRKKKHNRNKLSTRQQHRVPQPVPLPKRYHQQNSFWVLIIHAASRQPLYFPRACLFLLCFSLPRCLPTLRYFLPRRERRPVQVSITI